MKPFSFIKKIAIFLAIFFVCICGLYAQNQNNYILLENGVTLNFNTSPMSIEYKNHKSTSATVCDKNGQIAFYANYSIENGKNYYNIYDKDDNLVFSFITYLVEWRNYAIKNPTEENTYNFLAVITKLLINGKWEYRLLSVKIKINDGKYEITSNTIDKVCSAVIPYIYDNNIYVVCNNCENSSINVYLVQNDKFILMSSYEKCVLPIEDKLGFIKFSNDISKLIVEDFEYFYVFDYDVKTSQIIGHKMFEIEDSMCFEFSDDNKYIYISKMDLNKNLFSVVKYKTSDFVENAMQSEYETIFTETGYYGVFVDMLLCNDGNIYIICDKDSDIRVIKNTNSEKNEIGYITGNKKECNFFPNIVRISNMIEYTKSCNEVYFKYVGYPVKTYSWDFGDNTQKSQLETPSHTYEKTGIYTVVLKVTLHDNTERTISKEINLPRINNLRIEKVFEN